MKELKPLKKPAQPFHTGEADGADAAARPDFAAAHNSPAHVSPAEVSHAEVSHAQKNSAQASQFAGCACSGKNLTRLVRPAILTVLARENLHGYLILERLSGMAMFRGQPVDPTGLYRVLKSMETEGLVVCAWDLQGNGPARRRYALTDRGLSCLGQWLGTLEEYQTSVEEIVNNIRGVLDNGAVPARVASMPTSGQKQPGATSSGNCCCGAKSQRASIDSSGPLHDS
ncbi:MAG: PadR family transcriptional regulator [Desulfovibrio sp.]|nr:PadR family transcriptional regulator [Desulfovibrio sp.]